MKYKGVITAYTSGGRQLEGYIIADTIAEADELVKARNIGERIISDIVPVSPLPDPAAWTGDGVMRGSPELLKNVMFLSYVGFASGRLTLDEALGSESLLSELIAIQSERPPARSAELMQRLYHLHSIVPGVWPQLDGEYVILSIKRGETRTVSNVVPGSLITNLGPGQVVIRDFVAEGNGYKEEMSTVLFERKLQGGTSARAEISSDRITVESDRRASKIRVMVQAVERKEDRGESAARSVAI